MNLWTANNIYLVIAGVFLLLILLVGTVFFLFLSQRRKIYQLEGLLNRHPDKFLEKAVEIEELERQRISRIIKNAASVNSSPKETAAFDHYQHIRKTTIHYQQEGNRQNDKLINTLLGISNDLRSNVIRQFGFYEAIKHFTTKITHDSGIIPEFQLDNSYQKQQEEKEIILFRIYQELIKNVISHGVPGMLAITTDVGENELELIILHNGEGLTQRSYESMLENHAAIGLQNIRNRLALLKGRIFFQYKNDVQKIFLHVPFTD